MARAQALAARPTRALGLTKRLLQSAATNSFEAQLDAEAQAQSLAGSSADYTEALAAFRERRPPVFTGR
jgi:2-(1,2-epoxy-1,2-dihydrophenyl)acetyl-CoA isomerase